MAERRRIQRVNETLRQELSELISRELRDPRLDLLISITEVRVSHDLRHARVYVSVLGTPEERVSVLKGLRSATAFVRVHLSERLKLRNAPMLHFQTDDSIERGTRVLTILNDVAPELEPAAPAPPPQP